MSSMFWGLKLEPGKQYSTTVDKSFHISMAALDCQSIKKDGEVVSVMIEEEGGAYIICNLNKEGILQSHLDLNFMTGDRITLFCKGQGVVHLSGYMVPDDDDDFPGGMDEEEEGEEEEEEDEDEEIEEPAALKNQKKQTQKEAKGVKRMLSPESASAAKKSKKIAAQNDLSDEEDEEDSDDDDDIFEDDDLDMDEAEDEDEESEEEEDEDQPEKEAEVPVPLSKNQKKKKKKQQLQQQQQQNAASKSTPNKQENQKMANGVATPGSTKKDKKKGAETASPAVEKQDQQQKKTGGVDIKDLKVGNGPLCKPGKMVVVYYTGRLKSNNKVFDSVTQGSGFKFRLGKGEVIKGWDIGLNGMKVGGKRVITCPPHAAYGKQGAPPSVPPNSTLVFEVELKGVH